jgi:AcrR family transcriptional regulator
LIRFITHQTDFEQWPTLEPNAPFEYSIDTGDGIRDALVNAAASVIARSGIERTTTQRVARAAGLPPSALFAEYQNRQALFTDVVSKLLKEIYQEHRYRRLYGENPQPHTPTDPVAHWDDPRLVQYRESMVTSVAANTMGLLSDIGLTHRRIRLEFQLAAIHDAGVRSELQRVDEMTNVMTTSLQQSLFGLPSSIAGPGARTSRTIAQGAMLLEDVSQMLNGRDIRYINGPLADFYCRDALGLSTDPTSAALSPQ